jgi:hypothetical protein
MVRPRAQQVYDRAMVTAFVCPNCGAPLAAPKPAGGAAVVTCGYCRAAVQLGGGAQAVVASAGPRQAASSRPTRDETRRFGELAVANGGSGLAAALEAAARGALAAHGDQRAMAYAVSHLATDLERERGVEVANDAGVLTRLADAYYLAVEEVAGKGEAEVNLPFLTATGQGPVHLQRTVTAADLARMTAAPPTEGETKKRGWFR